MKNAHRAAALLVAVLSLGGCSARAGDLPTVTVPIRGHDFVLEVANTEAAREHGLMMRDSLPADHGMLFVFEEPGEYPFWMHNTRIPLEIIYLSKDDKVVDIQTRRAYDETSIPSKAPALYVIELNAGAADKIGLKEGDAISIPVNELKHLTPGTEK